MSVQALSPQSVHVFPFITIHLSLQGLYPHYIWHLVSSTIDAAAFDFFFASTWQPGEFHSYASHPHA